jgi:peptidoglycan/xylan/chitin deacetylase (PgdA/CDA1 family)
VDALGGVAIGIAAFSAAAVPMTYATFVPQSRLWGRVIWRGDTRSNRVALTFDDGPTAPYTGEILDALGAGNVKATFFVVGENAQHHPELIRRMHDEGHVIGNHTWSHPHYGWSRGVAYWREELRRTDALIEQITGMRPTLFRPPLGAKTVFTLRAARGMGHSAVAWSRRSLDGLRTTPEQIITRLAPTRGGDIVLLHDGVAPNSIGRDPTATVRAIDPLLAMLRQRGLEPVAVPQLLERAMAS